MRPIVCLDPEAAAKRMMLAHFAGKIPQTISPADALALMLEFNQWLVDTTAILQRVLMEKLNTELPHPVIVRKEGA